MTHFPLLRIALLFTMAQHKNTNETFQAYGTKSLTVGVPAVTNSAAMLSSCTVGTMISTCHRLRK